MATAINMKPLTLIIGKSGTGKDYLAHVFGMSRIPSYTPRPIRKGEVEGIGHRFVKCKDEECYAALARLGDVAASTLFHGHFYWVDFDDIRNPQWDAYVIDVKGAYDILNFCMGMREFKVVVVTAPWWRRLLRMWKRDGLRQALKRLRHDCNAFAGLDNFIGQCRRSQLVPIFEVRS